MRRALLLVGVMALVSCGGGGGDGGPTAPPSSATLQVAGFWVGTWYPVSLGATSTMTLSQSGSNLTGTVTIFNNTFPITGTASSSRITWKIPDGGCGSLTGDGSASTPIPAQLAGSITFDARGCSGGALYNGPIVWNRSRASASAERLASAKGAVSGTWQESLRRPKARGVLGNRRRGDWYTGDYGRNCARRGCGDAALETCRGAPSRVLRSGRCCSWRGSPIGSRPRRSVR